MTVEELIEELKRFHPKDRVMVKATASDYTGRIYCVNSNIESVLRSNGEFGAGVTIKAQ